jgi:Holliday junction resolvase
MDGRGKRNKGATGERELAALLSDALGRVVKRNLGQAREGGCDINIQHWNIECKRQEKIKIYDWMQQAKESCAAGQSPVVAFRKNGKDWLVTMTLNDWIGLVRECLESDSENVGKQR